MVTETERDRPTRRVLDHMAQAAARKLKKLQCPPEVPADCLAATSPDPDLPANTASSTRRGTKQESAGQTLS
jgi:hypothetical protein